MHIITRAEWGARAPRRRDPVNWPVGVDLWVHHSSGDNDLVGAGPSAEAATIRGIQNFHMDNPDRLWNDIGYAFVVAPSGRVYMGRGEAHGAHSPEHGKNSEPSVCMLGNYATVEPTHAIHLSIYALMDVIDAGDLRGHRENTSTTCPGDAGYHKVVTGPPPSIAQLDPLTLHERLVRAGFSPRSAEQAVRLVKSGHQGTTPRATDSRTFRRLRTAGFGAGSARIIVRALRD